ncbi:MAG: DUF4401 domain-containing protein [Woeseiaceae bacterium]|nr:DUF4401 domain-containing protein [Woeseiaceae bacterium]
MSRPASLEAVLDGLQAEERLTGPAVADGRALIERLHGVQPWYVRTMVGFGAWLASLLLIGFVAGFGLAVGGSTFLGLALMVTAVLVRRQPAVAANDFVIQSTMAVSLAGQALFAWGIANLLPGDEFKLGCIVVAVVSSAMFVAFPDRVHRVIMVLIAASALTALVYALETNGIVPVLGPVLAGLLVLLDRRHAALVAKGHGPWLRPLENGVMLAAFGCLMLSTIYVLPDLGSDFTFYPQPWISTILLGALLLYVGGDVFARLAGPLRRNARLLVYCLLALLVIAAWAVPGLLLALVVVMLGAACGRRGFVIAGIAFLAVFVTTYFYGIEVTLLTKSVTLVATGAVILLARWLLLQVLAGPGDA